MPKVWLGPVGKISKGHVLDVAVKPFERALKDQDHRLYVRWNPKKLRGEGCWEIRIRPLLKSALYAGSYNGHDILMVDYHEFDDIHHVLDCAFLNYDQIRKLKKMDTNNSDHWVHDIEYKEHQRTNEIAAKALAERKYNLKQNKAAIREIYERARSGENIHRIIGETSWTTGVDQALFDNNRSK